MVCNVTSRKGNSNISAVSVNEERSCFKSLSSIVNSSGEVQIIFGKY